MAYNLILVDASYKAPTYLHRMNVITGDYLTPINVTATSLNETANRIIEVLIRDKPDKIIFDKFGIGGHLHEIFISYLKSGIHADRISVDAFGTITYK